MTERMSFRRRALYILIVIVLLVFTNSTVFAVQEAKASSTASSGTVTASSLRVRSGAGTTYDTLGYLSYGTVITINGTTKDSNNTAWYRISYNSSVGYVSSEYVTVTSTSPVYKPDSDFEAYMNSQNFPESYKSELRELHAKYPNWVFKANHTNLEWSDAVAAENQVGTSLISRNSIASWKSMDKGAYDFANKTWYGFDGYSWVAASEQIIEYYMDPRNFLDDTYIFMFEKLSYDEEVHNIEGVKRILSGTFMSENFTTPDTKQTLSYAQTFMDAAVASGVSPYHLASRARQEQGAYGTTLSSGTVGGYENYFNYFNIQAYATSTLTAQQMGAKYASTTNSKYLLPWTNQYKSIKGGSIFIGNSYINRGQDTLYLQKFDVVDGGNGYYNHQYMTNVQAAASEAASMKRAYSSDILNSALVFSIPVYKNMPTSACIKPTSTGTNNNLLTSLAVSNASISPAFSMYTQSYTLNVANNVSSVTITASLSDANAKITGVGTKSLAVGKNIQTITVTAPSGAVRQYTITITRASGSGSAPVTPPPPSYVKGDVNMDDSIDTLDALFILQHVVGKKLLTGNAKLAADVNSDGKVDVVDALLILRYNAGLITSFK